MITPDPHRFVVESELLTLLFTEGSAPCVKTIYSWRKARIIPYHKIGQQIFYDPEEVREHLKKNNRVKAICQ